MAKLILNESEILFDIVKPCPIGMSEHMRVQFADTRLSAKFLDLLIDAAVDHPGTLGTD